MVEILHDGQPVRRVAVQVRLMLSEKAARAQVPRGSVILLTIQRGSATVSAQGVALQDAEIGQTAPFKVQATGRIVQARIESASTAAVLDQ
jgi:flagella basal body P-ring formation protein FlgA